MLADDLAKKLMEHPGAVVVVSGHDHSYRRVSCVGFTKAEQVGSYIGEYSEKCRIDDGEIIEVLVID